jgi:hypothetical protein
MEARAAHGDPVAEEVLAGPHDHAVTVGVLVEHVERLATAELQAAALADSEPLVPTVAPEEPAPGVDYVAGAFSEPAVPGQEAGAVGTCEEAQILGVGLGRDGKTGFGRNPPDLGLG